MGSLYIAYIKKRKGGDRSILHPSRFSTLPLSSRKAMQKSTTTFTTSKQKLPKSQFLRIFSCQKPYWDQARLSSLVNKQVAVRVLVPGAGLV